MVVDTRCGTLNDPRRCPLDLLGQVLVHRWTLGRKGRHLGNTWLSSLEKLGLTPKRGLWSTLGHCVFLRLAGAILAWATPAWRGAICSTGMLEALAENGCPL